MYDVFVLEMYINYDKIIYNLIEKSVGIGQQLYIIYIVIFCVISYSIYVVNINYCIIDKSMEFILKKVILIYVNVFINNM